MMASRYRIITLGLALLILRIPFPSAQPENVFKLDRLTVENGLSNPKVGAVAQDQRGFLWVATADGLNRYDGYSFKSYFKIPDDTTSLSDSWIEALFVDSRNRMWVGTHAGLNLYDPTTERFRQIQDDTRNAGHLRREWVRCITETKAGEILTGTDTGIYIIPPSTLSPAYHKLEIVKSGNLLKQGTVLEIFEDRYKHIWLGTLSAGVYIFNHAKRSFTKVVGLKFQDQDIDNVLTIYEDAFGNLWFGTYGRGLYVFRGGIARPADSLSVSRRPSSHYLDQKSISDLLEDQNGNLWAATFGSGLYRYKPAADRFIPQEQGREPGGAEIDEVTMDLFEDRSGNLWVGTYRGLNKIRSRAKNFGFREIPSDSASQHEIAVWSVTDLRNGNILFGTDRGVYELAQGNGEIRPLDLPFPTVSQVRPVHFQAVLEDQTGQLWLGTFGYGVYRFDRTSGAFLHFGKRDEDNTDGLLNTFVTAIAEEKSGTIWVATLGGLHRFNPTTGGFDLFWFTRRDSVRGRYNSFEQICPDRHGNLWLAALEGLLQFDPQTETFTAYFHDPDDPKSISNNLVSAIAEDRDGYLWIGTKEGLDRFDPVTGQTTRYSEKDGLPGTYFVTLMIDNDNFLWGTSETAGLTRIDFRDLTNLKVRNYDVKDGLGTNEFQLGAKYKSATGELFFGNAKGFIKFHPDRIKDNTNVPPVVLTAMSKFNEPIEMDSSISELKEIELSHRDNFISFEFSALDYTVPARNRYAYKMEGLEPDWVYVGDRRFASYTNLDPGEYVFRVKGSNNDGIWNEIGASVKVSVIPPPWQRSWAYLFYALVGIFLLIAGRRYDLNRKIQKQEEQARRQHEEARLKEIQLRAEAAEFQAKALEAEAEVEKHKMRNIIATDLHDEIGSNLSSIALASEMMGRLSGLSDDMKSYISDIHRAARDSTEAIRDIVWFINPMSDQLIDLVTRMKETANNLLGEQEHEFESPVIEPGLKIEPEIKRNIYLIYKEALNNIVKHSQAEKVKISLSLGNGELAMAVQDDGKGFLEADTRNGNGLRNYRIRAEQVSGKLGLQSAPGEGTRVSFSVKIA